MQGGVKSKREKEVNRIIKEKKKNVYKLCYLLITRTYVNKIVNL